jgi:hypothetical protein
MPSPLDRARALAIAQDFGAEALTLNGQLVAADPTDVASRTRLARCYREAGRLDDSEAEYREVLRQDPRNRIAAGGLEAIERERHTGGAVPEAVGAPRAPRARRSTPASSPERRPGASGPAAPLIFSGFRQQDFADLQLCPPTEVRARFAPRVVDFVKRVNALRSSEEIASVREAGRRQLFRLGRADVHVGHAHWYVFNLGGRWEPQFNIGMYGGTQKGGDWLRIGMGFNLSDGGADPDRAEGVRAVRDHFRRFQAVLTSAPRSLFLGWMIKENGLLQQDGSGPRLDLPQASQAADLIVGSVPERTDWVFFGKWLSPGRPDDVAVLSDAVTLVRTVDRVFTGLLPLWRALWE